MTDEIKPLVITIKLFYIFYNIRYHIKLKLIAPQFSIKLTIKIRLLLSINIVEIKLYLNCRK